jgi:hypothetical protein
MGRRMRKSIIRSSAAAALLLTCLASTTRAALVVQTGSVVDTHVTGSSPTNDISSVDSPLTTAESDNYGIEEVDDSATGGLAYTTNDFYFSGTLNHTGTDYQGGYTPNDGGYSDADIFFTVDQNGIYVVAGGIAGPNDPEGYGDSTGYLLILTDVTASNESLVDIVETGETADYTYATPDNLTASLVQGDAYQLEIEASQTFENSDYGDASKTFDGSLMLQSVPEPTSLSILASYTIALLTRRRRSN